VQTEDGRGHKRYEVNGTGRSDELPLRTHALPASERLQSKRFEWNGMKPLLSHLWSDHAENDAQLTQSKFPENLNSVHHGDNLPWLRDLPDGCIDLAYLDPPFNTGRALEGSNGVYQDSWPSVEAYVEFIRPRVFEIHRLLKSTGSILLHCDWRVCHHLRFMLDDVFGSEQFINSLVWTYGLGGSSPRRFARKHDDILFYGKTNEYFFHPPMVPATSMRMRGQLKKCTDVLSIPTINNMANERTGYPTQKPIALLSLLVDACCPREGVVLDCFCGSGTTLVAAKQSGRSWLGCDAQAEAVEIARRRISETRVPIAFVDAPPEEEHDSG
jgi:site-specific DNA-methyltransferase (adenine-specific)